MNYSFDVFINQLTTGGPHLVLLFQNYLNGHFRNLNFELELPVREYPHQIWPQI